MDEALARQRFEQALSTYEQAFGTFFLARLLDLAITYPQDLCRVEFAVHDFMFNPQGTLHGGLIATVMDISMGHLLRRRNGLGGATLEMKVQYLRSLGIGTVRCEGRVLREGRSIAFLEARLFDAQGRLAAMATSTWKPAEG